jgi:hypothetical protein
LTTLPVMRTFHLDRSSAPERKSSKNRIWLFLWGGAGSVADIDWFLGIDLIRNAAGLVRLLSQGTR